MEKVNKSGTVRELRIVFQPWTRRVEIREIQRNTEVYVGERRMVETHSRFMGYLLWIFGFTGAHRFYYGRPISGTIYFFTLGLLFIGWIVDLFLIPSMERTAALRFRPGRIDYSLAWILLTFLGILGVHRMYMGKWITGILYMLTGGFFLIGYVYDFWTLNDQITVINAS